jgi:hypothetical protein
LHKRLLWLLLCALIFSISAPATASTDAPEWQNIAPGIDYRKFQLPDPNNVFVARMDRNNPVATLESTIAQGKLIEGRETVSSMYSRYDQAINFWGGSSNPANWGMRNQAVVAINGSYFDYGDGSPQGGMVQSGWYAKRFDDLGGWGGFIWKLDRQAFISECLDHNPTKQFVTYPATGVTQEIARVNRPRVTNILVMYTPQYNDRTLNDKSGVEVVVELTQPTMIMPAPAYISGIVREIHKGEGKTLIPFNSIVLSAVGEAGRILMDNIRIGSEVHITQEITSYEYDCSSSYKISWTKTYASIQGAFFFLKDGEIRDYSDLGASRRNPRTAIAYNDQYIYFIVVDGRDLYHSVGMTIHELAVFTRDVLDATWGVAEDGGGSSTMVINGWVVNNTYCNIYSCAGYTTPYLPVDPINLYSEQTDLQTGSNVLNTNAGVERAVANGMLMVVALPGEYSHSFSPGDPVITTADTELRLGPGTNYASITTLSQGSQGIIKKQFNNLEGVLAKGTNWWYVDFDGKIGWAAEEALFSPGIADGGQNLRDLLWKPHYLVGGFHLNLPR